jgi:hypothetical protein
MAVVRSVCAATLPWLISFSLDECSHSTGASGFARAFSKSLHEGDCSLIWLRGDNPLRRRTSGGRKHRARLVAQPLQLAVGGPILSQHPIHDDRVRRPA